jgi:hypothetical protein
VPVIHSNTDYQPGQLAAQAERTLARYHTSFSGRTPAFGTGLGSTMAACVQRVTSGAQPSLVDVARYRGQSATVIMRATAGGQTGMVWVVGPGCSGTSPDLIVHAPLTGPAESSPRAARPRGELAGNRRPAPARSGISEP